MSSYKAYIKIAENHYREQYGLSFEEFEKNQKFKHRPGVTISQQDNKDEALDTINNAQLHYDAHYASFTEWKHCLGVSTLTLQNIMGMTWKTFSKKKLIISYKNIAMTHPVFGGDTLYAESEIIDKEEYIHDADVGLLTVQTTAFNQENSVVAKVLYKILIYKKGKHPLDSDLPKEAFNFEGKKFLAYRQLEDGFYIEQVGFYYEDLLVGELYEHRPAKTFTADENRAHVLRALEWNPQYSNSDYIEKYLAGNMVINETFLIGAITALTTRTFGRVVANLQWKDIELATPVFAGDTVYCQSEIVSKRESKSRPAQGIIESKTQAFNQNGKLVCVYERHFLVYKKGLGPYKSAGY